MTKRLTGTVLALQLVACGSAVLPLDAGHIDNLQSADAGVVDAGVVDAGHKADGCVGSFGSAFTSSFGRADGTVVAVVPPGWDCPMPNRDHVVIQVSIDGGVQRLVVNVESRFGDPKIRFRTRQGALPPPAWSEGWHPGVALDYPSLGLHSDAGWEDLTLEHAALRVYDAVPVGAPLSVYATSSGGAQAASAHKIHRNGQQNDGAIVVDPMGAEPRWLLFHFANQSF